MSLDTRLQSMWYASGSRWLAMILSPLSWIFRFAVAMRRAAYRAGVLRSIRMERPVIVIGNITVGGTGKTPFTIWLASQLLARGDRVGIVLRGYGGKSAQWPREVSSGTSWEEVGDEAVLLARRTGAIVVAGPDRVAAARRAIELGATVVLCDDGLQHYRLDRDREFAVVDGRRGLGNGRMLPAGPLREPPERLKQVDLIVTTSRSSDAAQSSLYNEALKPGVRAVTRLTQVRALLSGEIRTLEDFRGTPVHAIAGIGNPSAFFDALTAAGLQVHARALDDHARLTRDDVIFPDDAPVLMTEKDAVKCLGLADARHWTVAMDIELSETDAAVVHSLLEGILQRLTVDG